MIKLESIYKSLNIEEKEVTPVLLLITQSIFIGIFYGAYDIGAHTLFLNVFPEDMIPKAYIISGLVGIGLTSLFSKIQTKISFSRLANYSLLFISVIILLMRSMFAFMETSWVVFIVFIFFGPLNIIAILSFWGTVGRIFNLRQGKRLYGIIDTGQIIGIIISSFAIPIFIHLLNGTNNILLISAVSIFLAMVIEIVISRRFKFGEDEDADEEASSNEAISKDDQVKLKDFTKNPYILYMALFVVFSMFAAFFVQYSFLVVAKENYPVEEDMAKYLGFFTGSMMVFTLLIKTFVYSKLMKTYGLKISLILSPILLALFTLTAIAAGFFGGFTEASPGFIYFFLLISLSKLFNKTLKDSLEMPSFKLLYQALARKIRFDVQAKIDGTINEIAALLSGLILYTLGIIAFVKLIHFSVVLLILLGIWTFITLRLYKEYRNNLEKSLEESKELDIDNVETNLIKSFEHKTTDNLDLVKRLSLIRDSLPLVYIKNIIQFLKQEEQVHFLKTYKSHYIEAYFLFLANKLSFKPTVFEKIKPLTIKGLLPKDIITYLKDESPDVYLPCVNYILSLNTKNQLVILTSLLRTPDINVQRIAIRLSGEIGEKETCGTLVEYLDTLSFFPSAMISLSQMVDNCYKQLIQMFYKTDITISTQLAIIKLLGIVDNENSKSFLLENLSHHKSLIFKQSIQSLSDLGYQADEDEQARFFHPITDVIQTLAWDVSAMASVNSIEEPYLEQSLKYEFQRHQNLLFELLSITYNPQSVMHVKDYLESDTAEGVGYALELFDIFISDEIKPIVLLIFEDMTLAEKTRQLQDHFPVEIMSTEELIVNVLNRDPNLISLSTKQIALDLYPKYYNNVSNDIIAQLFSPIESLNVQAFKVINKISPDKLKELLTRIEVKKGFETGVQLKSDSFKSADYEDYIESKSRIASSFSKLDINPIEIADYLDLGSEMRKISFSDNEVNEYFVFLIIDRDKLLNNSDFELADSLFYFEYLQDGIDWQNESIGNNIIMGIKKQNLYQLQLMNDIFIQNLITLS